MKRRRQVYYELISILLLIQLRKNIQKKTANRN